MIGISAKIIRNFTFAQIAKQSIFATAQALTKTAKDAQKDEIDSLQQNFTLRGRWFEQSNKFGIKIKPAKKEDLKAIIYTNADWLELHETGGTKIPKGNTIAIPTSEVRRNKKDIITKANRPRNLKNAFIITNRNGHKVLVQRKGRGKRKQLVFLYDLTVAANIPKRPTFYAPVLKSIEQNFQRNFETSLRRALATAK